MFTKFQEKILNDIIIDNDKIKLESYLKNGGEINEKLDIINHRNEIMITYTYPLFAAMLMSNYDLIPIMIQYGADTSLKLRDKYVFINRLYFDFIYEKNNNVKDKIKNIFLFSLKYCNWNEKDYNNEDIIELIKSSNVFFFKYIIKKYPDKYKKYLRYKNMNDFNI